MYDRWTADHDAKLAVLERVSNPSAQQRGSLAAMRMMSQDMTPRRARIDDLTHLWADRSERRR